MSPERRARYAAGSRWVVKIGSAMITNQGRGLDRDRIADWTAQIVDLRAQGVDVVLVSSGSIAEGLSRLGWRQRPNSLDRLQAAAAIGQMGLVQAYESAFQGHGIGTAQILLTHQDIANRQRYINIRSTVSTLLGLGIVPIVNENDTVATEEIRFGDNDTLGALVANLIDAELFVILTDQLGMYDADPRVTPDAQLISEASANDSRLAAMAGEGGMLGRGGMITKVEAARIAARSGTATLIASGHADEVLRQIRAAAPIGTLLWPHQEPTAARKRWMAQLPRKGAVKIDSGAVRVLRESGRSLLPVGVKQVSGEFARGDLVACVDCDGVPVALGLVNYSLTEARQIIGRPSGAIAEALGYAREPELIHRDNLLLL